MKAKFWDVKTRENIEAEVLDCVTYANGRSAFKAKTADGRPLTRFVKADEAAAFKGAAPAKKCGCCKKK